MNFSSVALFFSFPRCIAAHHFIPLIIPFFLGICYLARWSTGTGAHNNALSNSLPSFWLRDAVVMIRYIHTYILWHTKIVNGRKPISTCEWAAILGFANTCFLSIYRLFVIQTERKAAYAVRYNFDWSDRLSSCRLNSALFLPHIECRNMWRELRG